MIKIKHILRNLSLIALFFAAVLVGGYAISNDQLVEAEDLVDCSPSSYIMFPNTDGMVLSGDELLKVVEPNHSAVDSVEFEVDGSILGEAVQDTNLEQRWLFEWDTASRVDGDYELYARITYTSNSVCQLGPRLIELANGVTETTDELKVIITPTGNWQGPKNVSFPFEAKAVMVDSFSGDTLVDVTEYASFSWTTTLGSINSSGRVGNFYSGPALGDGKVTLTGYYNSHSDSEKVNVKVFESSNSGSGSGGSSADSDSGSSSGDSDQTDQADNSYSDYFEDDDTSTTTIADDSNKQVVLRDGSGNLVLTSTGATVKIPQIYLLKNSTLAKCLKQRIGNEDYQDLLQRKRRLTGRLLEEAFSCFSDRKFIIPSTIAPVDPQRVGNINEKPEVKITQAENMPAESDQTHENLVLSGTAEPNKTVLIYIFSEPLVLTTQSDSNGNWSYVLEDPLEPGEHEAFVLVESEVEGDYVRSTAYTFAVTGNIATDTNPSGYGLFLVADDNRSTFYYILGTAAVVLLAALVLLRYIWKKTTSGSSDTKPLKPPNEQPTATK